MCFTLNGYTEDDIKEIEEIANRSETSNIKYMVAGLEVGASGNAHIQGFIHIEADPKKCGIKYWKEFANFGKRAFFANARGTDQQNRDYCSKEGPTIEIGEPTEAGDKYKLIYETAKENLEEALAIDYEFGIRNYNSLKSIFERAQSDSMPPEYKLTLRPWQEECVKRIKNQDSRKILFVVDEQGNTGKSELCKWLMVNEGAWACQGKL